MPREEIEARADQWYRGNPPPPLSERQAVVLRRVFHDVHWIAS